MDNDPKEHSPVERILSLQGQFDRIPKDLEKIVWNKY